jgi:hypothetical protein
MGVDGGAGNAISLSEVQTFYGGSNPISMSEYYRGGSEVPNTRTDTTTNTGVTGLVAQGFSSGATGGSSLDGNQSRLTIDGANNSNVNATVGTGTIVFSASTTVSVTKDGGSTILENQAHFRLDGYDFLDGSNAISQNVTAGSGADEGDFVTIATLTAEQASGTIGLRITFARSSGEGNGTSNTSVRIRRGGSVIHSLTTSFDNGVGSNSVANITNAQAGDIVEVSKTQSANTLGTFLPRECIGGNADKTYAAGSYAVAFRGTGGNNSNPGLDATLNFSTSGTVQYNSFGGGFTSVSTTDTNTTVNTNTNVPASGTVNMDVFNAPGTASP